MRPSAAQGHWYGQDRYGRILNVKSVARELPVVVEQIVPSAVCAACDVCCRFPESESVLRPYFTREEIQTAIAAGVSPDAFPDHAGTKIRLVPHGEGFICPAFNPATGQCGIYDSRPLDCRLYPVAVMWDRSHEQVVMGWDAKCPFIVQKLDTPESLAYVERTARMLETDAIAQTMVGNAELVGAFQDDVVVLKRLATITAGFRAMKSGSTSIFPGESTGHSESEKSSLIPFRPLTLADRAYVEKLLLAHSVGDQPLAAYSFPYHFIWRDLFSYEWVDLEGHFCLFATNADGTFLALPPVGPDPCGPVMPRIFALMTERNRVSGVSRIENLPGDFNERCRSHGYHVHPKAGDYLYRRRDLVALNGDQYKSQRALYNHCLKHAAPSVRQYQPADMPACLDLFQRWQQGLAMGDPAGFACAMAADAALALRVALQFSGELGLLGLVAEVEGRLAAYTLGYPLSDSVFCILFEIADRDVRGMAQYIFREFCRSLARFEFINAMDDSGLEGLRRAKQSYHPERIVTSYIVTAADGSAGPA